jgi:glycosyltransferase involved in cell wall biosynthesis
MGLYRNSTSLIAASLDEGFGLPIVEAAKYDLPIIARDIPVFREVGCDGVAYFSATTGSQLATFITDWLKKHRRGNTPSPTRIRHVTWRESALALIEKLEGPIGTKSNQSASAESQSATRMCA